MFPDQNATGFEPQASSPNTELAARGSKPVAVKTFIL